MFVCSGRLLFTSFVLVSGLSLLTAHLGNLYLSEVIKSAVKKAILSDMHYTEKLSGDNAKSNNNSNIDRMLLFERYGLYLHNIKQKIKPDTIQMYDNPR